MLPSPLHPAIVHFPIVLVLIGTVISVLALFTAGGHIRWFAGILLTLGALGVLIAINTGREESQALDRTTALNALLDGHEDWATRTGWLSVIAAVFAAGTVALTPWRPRAARIVGVVCATTAVGASLSVFETGRRGGEMVYRHAAGVNLASTPAPAPAGHPAVPAPSDPDARQRRRE